MDNFIMRKIGTVQVGESGFYLAIDKEYLSALQGLDGFSHVVVLWWFSECDNERNRASLLERSPYRNAPDVLGTFATRSPMRPNPIALSTAQVLSIDHECGIIELAYIDADDCTPLLDVKPYTPSLDRVEAPTVPSWCAHWPKSTEASGDFDWENEMTY